MAQIIMDSGLRTQDSGLRTQDSGLDSLFDSSQLKAYSGYFKDRAKLLQSSSGGGATALSEAVIREGGVVFGACYSKDFRSAEFACIESISDLRRLKGSKYIPTEKKVFHDGEYKTLWPFVAEKLASGKQVLFTGLGCDVAALKSYMAVNNVDTSNLYTADLICYGPAPLEVHTQYMDTLEQRYKSRLTSFTVRHKKDGWTPPYILAEFEDGRKFCTNFYGSDYGMAFGKYTRESCYNCRFKGANHQSDVTLGDFWGLTRDMAGWNPDGVSIFIVKTERGEKLMRKIDSLEFELSPADVRFAIEHNTMYYKSRKKPEDYGKFCADLKTLGLHRAIVNRIGKVRYFARHVRKFIPRPVVRLLKAILRR